MICELCGRETDKRYEIPLADDFEDGQPQFVKYQVCSSCVPEELIDIQNE